MATIQAKGWAAPDCKKPLEPFSFTRKAVGPSDVLIDIKYCGVCHSDIHQVRDEWGKGIYPMVPGHEIAGVVSQVGPDVKKYKVGDLVGVGCFVYACRSCKYCKSGDDQFCGKMVGTYNGRYYDKTPTYGGYSNNVVVHEDYVLRMPTSIPLEVCAPLLCAGVTTWSPLIHFGAGPGKKVAVLGLGGLGHIAVKLARAMGCEVHVLSHSDKKKEDAFKLGAHYFHNTHNAEVFKQLADTYDIILNTVSVDLDWEAYVNLLTVDGAMVALGIPEKDAIKLKVAPLLWKRRKVSGSIIGSIRETQDVLDFCNLHKIGCDVEVIPFEKINEAYDRMLKSDVKFRFVIDIATLK